MTKSLFLSLQPILPNDGISRKIINETTSLAKYNFDIDLGSIELINGNYYFAVKGEVVQKYGSSSRLWKIGCRYYWRSLVDFIIRNEYKFLYVRYTHFASPWILKMFHVLHESGIKIFLEIPTYPYDEEYVNRKGFFDNIAIRMERMCRQRIGKYVDRIVTFSSDETIWGCPTIRISNGVNIDNIPQWKGSFRNKNKFKMIAVAAFSEWHGYDRLLYGLANLISLNKDWRNISVEFIGPHNDTCNKLMTLSSKLGLDSIASFPGPMSGCELDLRFEYANIAIGSLGRHRSGITCIRTLKNREYAARAIPFVYSESDPDFDDKDYVLKVSADESPINIQELFEFADNHSSPQYQARAFVKDHLTWDCQMQIVNEHYSNL